jgi:membrane-associated phospholipid phosphatase
MTLNRRQAMKLAGFVAAGLASPPAQAAAPDTAALLMQWYRLVLQLVRHTPTYSPPVASRAFAYLGVAAYECMMVGHPGYQSLAGQLRDLKKPPPTDDRKFDAAHMLHGCMAAAVAYFFSNTGPIGQRAIKAMARKLSASLSGSVSDDMAAASEDRGRAIATHVHDWSQGDGGHVVENLGFPAVYQRGSKPQSWVPTSAINLQQTPLLPNWGQNRSFAMPDGAACPLPPPPDYSEAKDSAFYREAMEVYDISKALSEEQKLIARFWSDDPMLSPTPPGHWISIALQLARARNMDAVACADMLARLGIALADGFIACWHSKYEFDLLRPVTYIRRVIDPNWSSLLITPPFPEYPSGHSTQSGAAATVLTSFFGGDVAFSDETHLRDGLPARSFESFHAAAQEAALSRLYGGIHFRAAAERGILQGQCVGTFAAALRTKT